MCVLGQPEPVGSVLTFYSGYDTLEYSWVKATAVSVCLRILFVMLQNTNNGGASPVSENKEGRGKKRKGRVEGKPRPGQIRPKNN